MEWSLYYIISSKMSILSIPVPFQSIPVPFLCIPAHSCAFLPIPVYSCPFLCIPVPFLQIPVEWIHSHRNQWAWWSTALKRLTMSRRISKTNWCVYGINQTAVNWIPEFIQIRKGLNNVLADQCRTEVLLEEQSIRWRLLNKNFKRAAHSH